MLDPWHDSVLPHDPWFHWRFGTHRSKSSGSFHRLCLITHERNKRKSILERTNWKVLYWKQLIYCFDIMLVMLPKIFSNILPQYHAKSSGTIRQKLIFLIAWSLICISNHFSCWSDIEIKFMIILFSYELKPCRDQFFSYICWNMCQFSVPVSKAFSEVYNYSNQEGVEGKGKSAAVQKKFWIKRSFFYNECEKALKLFRIWKLTMRKSPKKERSQSQTNNSTKNFENLKHYYHPGCVKGI